MFPAGIGVTAGPPMGYNPRLITVTEGTEP
jgi:hypothetical protein